jgi:hypothetical protein
MRHGNPTWPFRMTELDMTPFLPDTRPTGSLNQSNDRATIHV